MFAPDKASLGSKPRDSREGHMNLIKEIGYFVKKYAEECGEVTDNYPSSGDSTSNMLTAVGFRLVGADWWQDD